MGKASPSSESPLLPVPSSSSSSSASSTPPAEGRPADRAGGAACTPWGPSEAARTCRGIPCRGSCSDLGRAPPPCAATGPVARRTRGRGAVAGCEKRTSVRAPEPPGDAVVAVAETAAAAAAAGGDGSRCGADVQELAEPALREEASEPAERCAATGAGGRVEGCGVASVSPAAPALMAMGVTDVTPPLLTRASSTRSSTWGLVGRGLGRGIGWRCISSRSAAVARPLRREADQRNMGSPRS